MISDSPCLLYLIHPIFCDKPGYALKLPEFETYLFSPEGLYETPPKQKKDCTYCVSVGERGKK